MTTFFIAPFRPADWQVSKSDLRIDPDWYRQRLTEDWPGIEFRATAGPSSLEWDFLVTQEGARIFGMLDSGLQVVSTDTPYEEYFLWHRSAITDQYELYLFNDSSLDSLQLTTRTTIEELKRFCGGQSV
jgi:hypothetical protein